MAHAQALGPGETVDRRYRLEASIADGGMSTVFLATDTRLDRHVALKLLSPSLAGDRSFVDRLELEAKSVARLSHPGVVQVFDHGFDRGQAFLVMELVPGGTLREILDERGPMPPHVVLSVLRPILGALDEAHNNGLIHRDIKPENILVSTSNSVKLADFGLVRAVAESRSTSQNVVMGTAAYLAPEQIATGETDPRSDLYSLGIVAFELLTGRVPFQGDTPVATAYQRLERPVPPPSSLVSGIPEDLDDLILHATERSPGSRLPTAREFLRRVEEVASRNRLFHVPVPAPSSSAWSRARERAAREAEASLSGAEDTAGETVFDIASRESSRFGGAAAGLAGAGAAGLAGAGLAGGAADANTRVQNGFPGRENAGARPVDPDSAAETTRLGPTGAVPGAGPDSGNAGAARHTAVYQGVPPGSPHGAPQRPAPAPDGTGTAHFAPGTPGAPGAPAGGGPPQGGLAPATPAPAPASRGTTLPAVPDSLRRKRGAGCLAAVLVLVLVVALGIAGWWFGSGRLVEIPSVSGMSVSEARTTLADAGLSTEEKDEYVDDVPNGYLLGTVPEPGNKVDPKDAVLLRVSAGSPVVPEISADRSQSAVEAAIRDRSLSPVIAAEPRYSADIPEGAVVELDPAPGTTLRVGDEVRLALSAGPAPVDVPRLAGMDVDAARQALETVGLTVGNVRKEFDTSQAAGDVVFSEPGAGSSVDQGSPVSLVVSTAAEIPDVRGMPLDEARSTLEGAGLRVVDGAAVSDEDVLAGKAASTSPKSGEKVDAANTVVTLTPSNSVKVPMVLGDTVSEAAKKLRDAGLEPQLSAGRTGVVYGQVPLPGKTVAPGSGVRLSSLG